MNKPMSNGGSNGGNNAFYNTPMTTLTHEQNLIIEEGIPLFEFHKVRRGKIEEKDLGYFNVKVYDNLNEFTHRASRRQRWFTGKSAHIPYTHQGKGLLVAFCPDDPEWYNRIRIAAAIHAGQYRIVRHHSMFGSLPEQRITDEMFYISHMTHDYVAKIDREVAFRSRNRDEVDEFVRKKQADSIKVQGPLFSKVAPIEKLIAVHGHNWIFSPEFQNEMKPAMQEKIANKFGSPGKSKAGVDPAEIESLIQTNIQAALQNMTADQVAALLKSKKAAAGETEDDDTNSVELSGIKTHKGEPIETANTNSLKAFAINQLGLKISGQKLTREEIISAIIKAKRGIQNEDSIDDVVGPPTAAENEARKSQGLDPLSTEEVEL